MERTKQKSRKDKPSKCVDSEKSSSFIADVKTFKENLKIREILRTVKMNSSMRIKAPRGSKVMQNKDFNESEDIFEDTINVDGVEPPSATNTILNTEIDGHLVSEEDDEVVSNAIVAETELMSGGENDKTDNVHKPKIIIEGLKECAEINSDVSDSSAVTPLPTDNSGVRYRDRKLSLDQTRLTRRDGLSQSEVDLYSLGKLPLERKSSFFRKKMDSFLKNTTEIFKRQSLGSKTFPSARRDCANSRMSVSMQSLNENSAFCGQYDNEPIDKYNEQQGSVTSLHSSATPARSNSSVSVNASDRPPLSEEEGVAGSCQGLLGSQLLPDTSTGISGVYQNYLQESLLNTRAISMSSGLDSATEHRRRRTSKSNRVTWLASESLTDYFRSLIQDEKGEETPENYSNSIPANKYGPRTDSKGRRLSYVRAVSREDSSLPTRTQDSSLRRKKITENEANRMVEIEILLAGFSANGIPPLFGYTMYQISPEADAYLKKLNSPEAIEELFPFIKDAEDQFRQEVLKELIYTESTYISHLKDIVRVYIASAHSLQNSGALPNVITDTLFINIPDILNANLQLWEISIFPMLNDAMINKTPFDFRKILPGFFEFSTIFNPYDEYMQNQMKVNKYLRRLQTRTDFNTYLSWCGSQDDNRLQIADMLVKPLQRFTKYNLIIERIKDYTHEEDDIPNLLRADAAIRSFVFSVNSNCRQLEEINNLLSLKIEPYEPDFKGNEEIERAFKTFSALNLFLPMTDCAPHVTRCLIHQGDLRYKDFQKEFDAHALLFTDMILICKKYTKTQKHACHWKMQRPKILLHRIVPHVELAKSSQSASSLIYVMLDEHGTAKGVFQLSELPKDPNPTQTIKVWEAKVQEAIMSYALIKWYSKYDIKDPSIIIMEYYDENFRRQNPKIYALEKNARTRIASMWKPNQETMKYIREAGREFEIPHTAYERDRGPMLLHTACEPGLQNINAWQARAPNFHPMTERVVTAYGSEPHISFSGSSYDDPSSFSLQRSGSSIECYFHSNIFDDVTPNITVNVINDDVSSTTDRSRQPSPPTLVVQNPSPVLSPGPRSASAGAGGSENTLRVASPCHSKVHSLPDINAEFYHVPVPKAMPLTASEKLYKSHQELLHRNRLAASQHNLLPNHRGTSYPPTSPTRSLKRGLAFSYSFRSNPPLTRSKNVNSISQNLQHELQKLTDVPRRILGRKSRQLRQRSPSPRTSTHHAEMNMPSTSSNKPQKMKTLFQRRSKDSTRSVSPERTKEEPNDESDYDADDDRSRRSSKSNKGDKIKHTVESCIVVDQDITASEEMVQLEPEAGKPVKKNKDKG